MSIQDFIEKKKFSRRSFLKGLAALGSASLLGGCGNKLSANIPLTKKKL